MSAHSFAGTGKCPPVLFQRGANVLHLVLGRGKCLGANVRGKMSRSSPIGDYMLPVFTGGAELH